MSTVISRLVKVLVFTLLCAATVTTASLHTADPCTQWDLNGQWLIVHANTGGYSPMFTLKVTETEIQGSASSGYFVKGGLFTRSYWVGINGSVQGTINGGSLELSLNWENTSEVYIYTGEINPQGRIQGSVYAKQNPETKADWYSDRLAKCLPSAIESTNDALAEKGQDIANQDPLAVALRNLQPEGETRRGFDIGMAAAEGDTAPGPGKQKIKDSLLPEEQRGFTAAVTFSLARNKNAKLAATGAAIAASDSIVAEARDTDLDPFFQLGFDIASGLFGDPAKGSEGSTQLGPGSLAIRRGLNASGQRGFDASMRHHFGRKYR